MRRETIAAALMCFFQVLLSPAAGAATASSANCIIVPKVVYASSATAISADLTSDSTAALQAALDHLSRGQSARLSPGTYHISKALVMRVPGVKLYGSLATLFSTSDHEGGLTIQADDVGVFDLTVDQASLARQSTPWAGGIAIYSERDGVVHTVSGTVIQHNTVKHAAAAGIFAYRAENFLIADNTVWRSLADGIHVTAGSKAGRIIANKVSQTGDDLIAVVSYAGDAKVKTASDRYRDWNGVLTGVNRNILIAKNDVSDQYWGRGISVVGGEQVTLINNKISLSPMAAGIYIERESSYKTFGVHDVLVRGNSVSRIQTNAPSYQPHPDEVHLTGHGAIEIGSLQDADELSDPRYREAFSVERVSLINNNVAHARFAGIRIGVGAPNTVSDVLVRANIVSDVTPNSIVEAAEGLKVNGAQCLSNRLNGVAWPNRCDLMRAQSPRAVIAARGATLRCSESGSLLVSGAEVR